MVASDHVITAGTHVYRLLWLTQNTTGEDCRTLDGGANLDWSHNQWARIQWKFGLTSVLYCDRPSAIYCHTHTYWYRQVTRQFTTIRSKGHFNMWTGGFRDWTISLDDHSTPEPQPPQFLFSCSYMLRKTVYEYYIPFLSGPLYGLNTTKYDTLDFDIKLLWRSAPPLITQKYCIW